ncbi:peptidase, M23 family [Formosa agariphila KMM 3901]|uniref:Peptidase, M23 family n=1 Tax=Formosa agariphila (strain DSM 15362 / KCTC 12365 / LMG 23005 / KMM 3901 / M-2Alg 35-1) TaxID=1347342 RepID=T2KJW6_FORAG|nr:M23 family metallopeptidase [Formosa agariphila]CDF79055.1 peptidase, M23 family [Formosa agariphila KMM 3901]
MRIPVFLFFFIPLTLFSQNPYPQDYFGNPLDIPIVLAGTFAELRFNHFHSGMDIKTQHREGLNVLASADGFVSRIKISPFGYGKALYITHPNGYTTVYAHLSKLAPKIEAYLKEQQYEKESYTIELFPPIKALVVKKGELVAYSGNTGSSAGPHLHFEIRDKNEHPINPMLFGINTKDTTRPLINALYAFPIDEDAQINKSNKKQQIRLIKQPDGNFTTESIEAVGKIGFGIETIDRQDLANNKNGVYNIQTLFNGNPNFEIDFRTFSFDETNDINRLIDYDIYKNEKDKIQKLFIDTNNGLSLYKNTLDNGYLTISDSTSAVYKIKVSDFRGNETSVTVSIDGKFNTDVLKTSPEVTPYYIYENQAATLSEENVTVNFYKNTFYEDFYIDFKVSNDTLQLLPIGHAARKNFNITFDISKYNEADKDKLFIAELVGYKKWPSYSSTKRTENTLSTFTKSLGYYTIASDTTAPKITAVNFKDEQWISNAKTLKVKITDDLSGISDYRATINGKWILMEYEYKTNTLTYNFDDQISTEPHNDFKIIVTDNVGNSSTFEARFHRK